MKARTIRKAKEDIISAEMFIDFYTSRTDEDEKDKAVDLKIQQLKTSIVFNKNFISHIQHNL